MCQLSKQQIIPLQDTVDPEEGNVHTGATPPWLLPDTDPYTRSEIGPTLEDFNKHSNPSKIMSQPPLPHPTAATHTHC